MRRPVLIVLGVLFGAASLSGAAGAAKLETRYLHPQTGVLLPPEPLEAVPGCLCSVHYKNVLPDPPAKPFRQSLEPPPIDSIPPVPSADDPTNTILKGSKP